MFERHKAKATIKDLQAEVQRLTAERDRTKAELTKVSKDLTSSRSLLSAYDATLSSYHALEEIGYDFLLQDNLTSSDIEQQIHDTEMALGRLVSDESVYIINKKYTVDGSLSKGQKFQKTFCKNLLIGFNAYADKKAKAINYQNFTKSTELIQRSFEKYNKQGAIIGVGINKKYLTYTLDLLKFKLQLKQRKAEEDDAIRKEKRRLKEQEELFAEIERTKKQLEKERKQYEQMLGRSVSLEEKKEIEDKIAEIDQREQDVDYRLQNAKAGWLYIISTPAMPDMVKIGATRRLSPFVRIRELSTASVPFPFICHGVVFSEDVFSLEANMHNRFNAQRVNKENRHKEFFGIAPNEAINTLKEEFNCHVQFAKEEDFNV